MKKISIQLFVLIYIKTTLITMKGLLQSQLEVVVRGLEVLSLLPEADGVHKELADVLEV